jgi:omega-6 fatty acid desaturase (delta-12 desaturase)
LKQIITGMFYSLLAAALTGSGQSVSDGLHWGSLQFFYKRNEIEVKEAIDSLQQRFEAFQERATTNWREVVAKYENPSLWRSIWQIINSFVPFFALFYLAYRTLEVSLLLSFAVSAIAAGFLVRIFIIFHDCGHGSFFKSQKANHVLGVISGILTFTPYWQWRHEHAIHHATSADLDRRGTGDVWTMTVEEFKASPWWRKMFYTVYRNPLVMFVIAPVLMFVVMHRFPNPEFGRREKFSVWFTNAALAAIVSVAAMTMGFKEFLLVQIPIIWISATAGIWLFYVQHQFEEGHWVRHPDWDYFTAAIKGSSFYKLPKVLQWFSGNIGVHHIHHLSPKIPNYLLEKCHNENEMFQEVRPLTLFGSFKALLFRLWDEKRRKYVWFDAADSVNAGGD